MMNMLKLGVGMEPDWNVDAIHGNFCTGCGKRDTGESFLRCSACEKTRYCSKECQVKCWSFHKKECQKIRKERKEEIKKHKAIATASNLHPDQFLDLALDIDTIWQWGVQLLQQNDLVDACYNFMIYYFLTKNDSDDVMVPMKIAAEKCWACRDPTEPLKPWILAVFILTHPETPKLLKQVEAFSVPEEPTRGSSWQELDKDKVGVAMCILFSARLLPKKMSKQKPDEEHASRQYMYNLVVQACKFLDPEQSIVLQFELGLATYEILEELPDGIDQTRKYFIKCSNVFEMVRKSGSGVPDCMKWMANEDFFCRIFDELPQIEEAARNGSIHVAGSRVRVFEYGRTNDSYEKPPCMVVSLNS